MARAHARQGDMRSGGPAWWFPVGVTGWHDIGGLVKARRRAEGLTQRAFASRHKLSPRTLSDIEVGERENYDEHTRGVVESILGWMPGSIDAVLAGTPPTPIPDDELDRLVALWPSLPPVARRALVAVAEALRTL